nr:NADH dehydrogenase subunit 3 [Neohydatothrips samayunkur]
MILIFFMIVSSFIVSLIFLFTTLFFSKKTINMREKTTCFECGFNMFNSSRLPFSMRFFLITIIFIIFDVEIALIIPISTVIMKTNIFKWFLTSNMFFVIILIGIFVEWKDGSLEWKK